MAWTDTTSLILGACNVSFGDPVIYTPQGSSSINITGVYDDLYQGVDPNTNLIVTLDQPVLGIRDSDLGIKPRQGDFVTVRGTDFTVKEVQIDGQGGSKLFLDRTS